MRLACGDIMMTGWRANRAFAGVLATILAAWSFHAHGRNHVDLVCPCYIEKNGGTVTITFGVRNVSSEASEGTGPLTAEVVMLATVNGYRGTFSFGSTSLGTGVAAGENLASASYTLDAPHYVPPGTHETYLSLREGDNQHDSVWMEHPVDAARATFRVRNEDFLADQDGDGVGDLNERIAGTDAADASSTPDESTVDVLALYTGAFVDLYNGDPFARILHVFTVANQIFRRAETGVRFRLVGFVETELRDDWDRFAEPPRAFLKPLEEAHGADLAMLFRPFVVGGAICGWASSPVASRGRIRFAERGGLERNFATVFGDCSGKTTAHEIGHVLGLGHSLRQLEEGTFRWSRGHYVYPEDGLGISIGPGTVMTYGLLYTDRFSSPDAICHIVPCGVASDRLDGADAVKSLQVTRYQVAAHRPAKPDNDGDGFVAAMDDDDNDPNIWRDTDGDGVNNEQDRDDDNDGVADDKDAFPLDSRDWADEDGDGVGDNTDAFPKDPGETADADGDGIGDNANRGVPLFLADGHPLGRQGFLRVINRSNAAGEVRIAAIDDDGVAARVVTMPIGAKRTVHFNSKHLEAGDAQRGLAGIGAGTGDWRLVLTSTLDIEVLAYVRAQGGFLTSVHETAPWVDGAYRVYFFNPAQNNRQRSLLRLANPNATPVDVTITGVDDRGASPGGAVRLTVPGAAARTLNAAQLETGDGLAGALGDGVGKWRLRVEATGDLRVMSLMESPTGHLSNLSTAPVLGLPHLDGGGDNLFMFPSTSDVRLQGFARVINRDIFPNFVAVFAYGGDGLRTTSLMLDLNAVAHFNSNDLEQGKPSIGMDGVGSIDQPWWLNVLGAEAIHPLAYVRTSEGFVTAMHDMAPATWYEEQGGAGRHEVVTFNPASNRQRRSLLRLVNPGVDLAVVTITGIDDAGETPGSQLRLEMPAASTRLLDASALESGDAAFAGALGDGQGKWRLVVKADATIGVMSLLKSADTGQFTNLSTATAPRPRWESPSGQKTDEGSS